MSREAMLGRIRQSLGRKAGAPLDPQPEPYFRTLQLTDRVTPFFAAINKLSGKTYFAESARAACDYVGSVISGRRAIASNAPFLVDCGITDLPGVLSGVYDRGQCRAACAEADFGISSADFALADTGTLVMLSSPEEARLISLLPPVHIAVVPQSKLVDNLDQVIQYMPHPADHTSSMVLITGPSRTADIEQILVRGVHGPAEIHVVLVAS